MEMMVSLCVVAYNEAKILPSLLEDLKKQTYPHNLTEIVLVNSMSTDETRKIMENFKITENDYHSITVVDNPKKIQASGWNVAIKNASGDVIIRIDAHSHIPKEFVEKNMILQESGEYVTGGVRPCLIEDGENPWKMTLLEVENSLFGSSISKARSSQEKAYVNSMFHAAYRREVFENVGGFNEKLLRTEDNEIHYRIRQYGYKLCLDPSIISFQYARGSFRKMIKQKYSNGEWIGLTLGVCPGCLSIYHFVPLAFVFGIILTSLLIGFGYSLPAIIMWAFYFLFTIISMAFTIKNKKANAFTILMPFLFLILHISYGVGTIVGIIKMPFFRKKYNKEP